MKPTLIIGASSNPSRYSYLAAQRLIRHNHPIYLIGLKSGNLFDEKIHTNMFPIEHLDTVTLYINPSRQPQYYDYILSLNPKRVIFNPGTENKAFEQLLIDKNIVPERACTLVMLSTGTY
tara:strand:+ start:170 stop:529 length:360 start_codon:yes stop_codon:yes gene_type:complete